MADNSSQPATSEQIRQEKEQWDAIVQRVLGVEAELVSVSRFYWESRVYRSSGRIAKIRRIDPRFYPQTELRSEVDCLRQLGRDATYDTHDDWEYSLQPELPGIPYSSFLFDQQDSAFSFRQRVHVLRRLVPALHQLHRSGLSHGDLNPENLLLDGDTVTIVDFDRAVRGSRLAVSLRDWIGLGRDLQRRTPVWKLALFTLAPKAKTVLRRLRWQVKEKRAALSAATSADQVGQLRQAWRLAGESSANSPGQGLAYYAWSFGDEHFVGERAWQLRWTAIARTVDFSGKSVLELGCNMGLLSTFAMMAGARAALGVDHDAKIVDSAQLIAAALDVPAQFEHLDLTDAADWESKLGGRDLVTALSVVHWLPNADRVLKFLSQHRELLYEGHDTLDIETERLRALGFDDVTVVMTTERGRELLYARQTTSD